MILRTASPWAAASAQRKDKHRYANQQLPRRDGLLSAPLRSGQRVHGPYRGPRLPHHHPSPAGRGPGRQAGPGRAVQRGKEGCFALHGRRPGGRHQGDLSRQCTGPGSRPGPHRPRHAGPPAPDRRAHCGHGRRHPGRGPAQGPRGSAPGLPHPAQWAGGQQSLRPPGRHRHHL